MSHEYSNIPEVKVDSTGHRYTELPADETQRPELAPGVQHTIGTVAITEADGTTPKHYVQYALDAGMDSPLFPVPQTEKKSSQQDNSFVAERHPEDMEQEI